MEHESTFVSGGEARVGGTQQESWLGELIHSMEPRRTAFHIPHPPDSRT